MSSLKVQLQPTFSPIFAQQQTKVTLPKLFLRYSSTTLAQHPQVENIQNNFYEAPKQSQNHCSPIFLCSESAFIMSDREDLDMFYSQFGVAPIPSPFSNFVHLTMVFKLATATSVQNHMDQAPQSSKVEPHTLKFRLGQLH